MPLDGWIDNKNDGLIDNKHNGWIANKTKNQKLQHPGILLYAGVGGGSAGGVGTFFC